MPIVDGEKIVIRILDYTMSSSGLESIGLTRKNYEKIQELIRKPNGIILVTGATGGIGRETAIQLSKLGAKVVITGRNEERLLETFSMLEGNGHSKYILEYIAIL